MPPSTIPPLMLVTDRHAPGGRDLVTVVRAALDAGLPAVQLRDKDLPGRTLWTLAEQLRRETRRTGAALYVNDRVDVALAVEADGVHLGGGSLPVGVTRSLVGRALQIGASTHAAAEIAERAAGGADFAFFGPVFATPGKTASGMGALATAVRAAPIPVLAIGGITPADVAAVRAAGAHGVAVIRAILAADDPTRATRALLGALR